MLMKNKSVTGFVVQTVDAPVRRADRREAPWIAVVAATAIRGEGPVDLNRSGHRSPPLRAGSLRPLNASNLHADSPRPIIGGWGLGPRGSLFPSVGSATPCGREQ